MKKTFKALLCCICAVALFSCEKETRISEEDKTVPEGYTIQTFTATGEAVITRTALNGANTVWSEHDQIKVVLNDGTAVNAELTDGAGTTTGEFEGMVPSGKTALYAVYPASAYASVDGTTVNVTVPAAQAGTFSAGNIAVAKVAAENNMNFKNVTAFLAFQLGAGSEVTKVEVTSVDGGALSGTVPVNCSGATPAPGTPASTASTVSMTTSGAGTYYMSIVQPAANHTKGLKMTYYTGSYTESGVYYLNRDLPVEANNIYTLGEVETDKNYYVTVSGAGNHTGMDWSNAFSKEEMFKRVTLTPAQAADAETKEAKLAAIDGATFHLASGSYAMGEEKTLALDETGTVTLTFKGGYNASTGARDIASNVTSFSGEDSYRIMTLDGNMDVTFDGISFVHGSDSGDGGAVKTSGGTWAFNECTFSDNTATNGGAMELAGGTVTITDCTFTGNSSTGSGGAIDSDGAQTDITGGTFSSNTAVRGGAVSLYNGVSRRTFREVTFSDNGNGSTEQGGAIYARYALDVKSCTFTGNTAQKGGAICVYEGFNTHVYGGSFENNTASINGGAIHVMNNGAYLNIEDYNGASAEFTGNSATRWGGALNIETAKSSKDNTVNDAIFKGNHSQYGGAVAVDGSGSTTKVYFARCTFGGTVSGEPNYSTSHGGAIIAENDTYVNVGNSTFIGNYSSEKNGGAFCLKGDSYMDLFRDSFRGNYAKSGGVGFASNNESKYPRLFVDECSFDANYITKYYGCLFNLNGIDDFCMHNSSVRNSYLTANEDGEKACWIDLDNIQGATSISNCSIIGDTKKSTSTVATSSSLVWSCSGSWTDYITNSIILQSSSDRKAIHSDGTSLDVSYTIYSDGDGISVASDNTSGKSSGDIDGLTWSDDASSSYYWKWDGTIDSGTTPPMPSQSDVNTRVSGICSDFVTWSGSDFGKDQRGVSRGNTWWPGAYQPDI